MSAVKKVMAMARHTMAAMLVLGCLLGGVSLGSVATAHAAAQPAQPAARDEFVPLKDIPPEDQLPAAPLVIAAYGVAWLVIVVYVWSLWRRLGRVEGELQTLNGRLSSRGR
jgi:CcmD family protein